MPWTDADVAFLRANHRRLKLPQLARALCRHEPAVTRKITLLGLCRASDWTPEQDAFLRKHVDRGWAWCAKETGRTIVSIYNRVRRLGIQLKMLKAGDLDKLRELHAQGFLNREIGERLGVSDECVRRWLNLWKLPMNKRDEAKRVATLKRNLMAKYGVDSVAKARKVRQRMIRKAVVAAGLESLGRQIVNAGRSTCPA